MPNIIITLPEALWEAIQSGRKKYECRKSLPKIELWESKVYVVIKGTSTVAGYFTVADIISSRDPEALWRDYGKHLCINREWFNRYVSGYSGIIHLWEVGKVKTLEGVNAEDLGIKRNPQSYIYTER